ncbi:SDR family NAD(P)-dependent oxidoreductase [Cellulomonas shaoxiangyii]|uniref:SDR family NAD(P)-dependent oxidoreductase n=1 Tax=Cellulomonas shaoxiangyii TaxID=2566013 RepID=A0A4V1CMC3_9CELL|nr:SDR family NAD(P)-dependent oxidoreductase [Cellulomonas shaoxiangyii]QCB92445.1 SDR family NAD(P)-dependent oxidoreductase [Cellulomonas shaoxiangyii]TGY85648.1 SDR family NAD(P)-dependent oxidoreductase [Cellulomonas shaoxiangyii]
MTDDPQQSRRTIVVTGASDGIGAAAARALAGEGHEVVVVGRNPERTHRVAAEVGAPAYLADFAHLDQVRELAARLLAAHPRIDVLLNNAGGLFPERVMTDDGLETTFQVDHLAPFLLTQLLRDRLLAAGGAVVTTSSTAHHRSRLTAEQVGVLGGPADTRRYVPFRAYGDAKLANILFTRELHRRYHRAGLSSAAVHPGGVATSFAGTSPDAFGWFYRSALGKRVLRTPEEGARDLVRLASGRPGVDWPSGQYWADGRITRVNRRADDPELARILWERSEQLVG